LFELSPLNELEAKDLKKRKLFFKKEIIVTKFTILIIISFCAFCANPILYLILKQECKLKFYFEFLTKNNYFLITLRKKKFKNMLSR
jgi:hypothetical protein